jgi:putative membrane protein
MSATALDRRSGILQSPLNVLRGFLIGMAELVPGVSGGTVALVTGVYERALNSATALGGAFVALAKGPDRRAGFRRRIGDVDWWLVLPALVGMAAAVLFAAGAVEALVSANPENARGLFFGLVAASLVVPLRMLPARTERGAGRIADVAAVVVAAVVAFVLVGFASNTTLEDPQLWFVFVAAAVAVCALVIPGVSGSFFLLAIGLYSPTLQAVDQRDLGYIAVFGLGAIVGLLTIVKGISVLLTRARRVTLLVMFGLMLGSLRALWPWQGGAGGDEGHGVLLAPTDPLAPVLLAVAGAAAVLALVTLEARATRRAAR